MYHGMKYHLHGQENTQSKRREKKAMYTTHFEFYDHRNPYITTNNKNLFEILRKYYYTQTRENIFYIEGLKEWNGKPKYNRENNKMLLRAIAQQWQADFANFNYSYSGYNVSIPSSDLSQLGDYKVYIKMVDQTTGHTVIKTLSNLKNSTLKFSLMGNRQLVISNTSSVMFTIK